MHSRWEQGVFFFPFFFFLLDFDAGRLETSGQFSGHCYIYGGFGFPHARTGEHASLDGGGEVVSFTFRSLRSRP